MEGDWPREEVLRAHDQIAATGVEMVPLEGAVMEAAAQLRSTYDALNVFDGVHLGTAHTLEEPIVSTDTLYPDIDEVEHRDPREFG